MSGRKPPPPPSDPWTIEFDESIVEGAFEVFDTHPPHTHTGCAQRRQRLDCLHEPEPSASRSSCSASGVRCATMCVGAGSTSASTVACSSWPSSSAPPPLRRSAPELGAGWPLWLKLLPAALTSVLSAADLVFGSSRKAWMHADFARRFVELERALAKDGAEVAEILDRRLAIEAEEPPPLRVLDTLCHNELVRAMGYPRESADPGLFLAARLRALLRPRRAPPPRRLKVYRGCECMPSPGHPAAVSAHGLGPPPCEERHGGEWR